MFNFTFLNGNYNSKMQLYFEKKKKLYTMQ